MSTAARVILIVLSLLAYAVSDRADSHTATLAYVLTGMFILVLSEIADRLKELVGLLKRRNER